MADKLTDNLAAFDSFLAEKGWKVWEQKDIEYGRQVVVTDGITRLPINFYTSGKIVPQGKASDMKAAVAEWANLLQAGLAGKVATGDQVSPPKNRIAKYLVIPRNIEPIRQEVIEKLAGQVIPKAPSGPAEVYRYEIRKDDHRLALTQYTSGVLMVQGLDCPYFDEVCEILDDHLTQSFSERAARFIPGEVERAATHSYLEGAEAENEAVRWLFSQIEQEVHTFLYSNDQRTLVSAAGVRNAIQKTGQALEDYSVVVMPFAKAYEGFLIRLAEQLQLVDRQIISHRASAIEVGAWLETIKARLPDARRFSEISDALTSAWGSRNKAMHSDFAHPFSTLKSFGEAEQEINTMLRAMSRAYRVFVAEGISLLPPREDKPDKPTPSAEREPERQFPLVNQSQLKERLVADGLHVEIRQADPHSFWSIIQKPDLVVFAQRQPPGLAIVKGRQTDEFCRKYADWLKPVEATSIEAQLRIGVDESGKGDLFGPLVVAGAVLTPEAELELARRGVRDSKTVSDSQIIELAALVRKSCVVEALVLLPPDYNRAYEQHGHNLNRLLAWGHAQVIAKLSRQTQAPRAISDQFGDEKLLIEALAAENCKVALEQRPKAESDLAVAAASIVARAEFIAAIRDYSVKAGIEIPLGASAQQVKEIGKQIYKRWGKRGLERIAKMHFKTIAEIMEG